MKLDSFTYVRTIDKNYALHVSYNVFYITDRNNFNIIYITANSDDRCTICNCRLGVHTGRGECAGCRACTPTWSLGKFRYTHHVLPRIRQAIAPLLF